MLTLFHILANCLCNTSIFWKINIFFIQIYAFSLLEPDIDDMSICMQLKKRTITNIGYATKVAYLANVRTARLADPESVEQVGIQTNASEHVAGPSVRPVACGCAPSGGIDASSG